jgi:hypothetical protein
MFCVKRPFGRGIFGVLKTKGMLMHDIAVVSLSMDKFAKTTYLAGVFLG